MKKIIKMIITFGLVFAAAGCSSDSKKNQEEESSSSSSSAIIENPITDPIELVTLDNFEKELGLTIDLTDEFTNVESKTVDGDDDSKIYELDFTYEDNDYSFRLSKSDELQDISGMNYEFGTGKSYDTGTGAECTIFTTEEGQGVSLWYADGYSHSLSCEANADASSLFALTATVQAGCTFNN